KKLDLANLSTLSTAPVYKVIRYLHFLAAASNSLFAVIHRLIHIVHSLFYPQNTFCPFARKSQQ
ncbi:hypothetical protein, partial [Desulfitobacterium sp.]|uniref:hypothetical protein n=1 Tax=Desulfitobacterium sp. TaxID=49981 RepID=UPI002C2A2780